MKTTLQAAFLCCLFLLLACKESESKSGDETPGGGGATSVRVAQGLDEPVCVTFAPGDSTRLFIVERTGRIRILHNGALLPEPFLDISNQVETGFGEQGLLSIAFHPQFADNGYCFVDYTRSGDGTTVISRFSVDNSVADPASEEIVLRITQPFLNHNGGLLVFGPDGNLWIGTGDGGSGGDPQGNAQNIESLLGKMLRINVDQIPYTIPADNPFVDAPGRDEIWAVGLRNPWRYDFDPENGTLYIADVGQNSYEWIHVTPDGRDGGLNYGWNIIEGRHCYPPSVADCDRDGLETPVYEYPHSDGCSVTGGVVYRGRAIPDLQGHYFFADYCNHWIRSFRYASGGITALTNRTAELAPAEGELKWISSFGRDYFGEIYLCCHLAGELYKIVPR